MALLELIGRLMLNTKPFEEGLKHAKNKARSEGGEIAHAFKHIGLGLLGIHSVGRMVEHIVGETIAWSKDINKAREEFERLGIAIDEGALKSIQQTGIELERLKVVLGMEVAPILGGIGQAFSMAGSTVARGLNYVLHPFDPDRNKKLDEDIARRAGALYGGEVTEEQQKKFLEDREKKFATLREQLEKIKEKNLTEEMTAEQKLAHLIDKRLALLELLKAPQSTEDRLKRSIEEQTLLGEILSLQRKAESGKAAALPALSHGSLAQVGGFGVTAQPVAHRVEQLVYYTQATAKSTQLTADELREFRLEMQFINNRDEFMNGFRKI